MFDDNAEFPNHFRLAATAYWLQAHAHGNAQTAKAWFFRAWVNPAGVAKLVVRACADNRFAIAKYRENAYPIWVGAG